MTIRRRRGPRAATLLVAFVVVALVTAGVVAACGGGPTSSPASAGDSSGASGGVPSPAGSRPSSPAIVTIVQPAPNEAVTGPTAHIVISLQNATVVPATTTNLRPDQGHIHLYVDNVLVSMNYGLTQDLPVHAGTYVLKAEFVASDHAPFDPRVWSDQVAFTVN
jgi:hypothetical protein